MTAHRSDTAAGAAARALKTHDITSQIFEVDRLIRQGNRRKLSNGDLFRCALVSRAFCEPALRMLWRAMTPPNPLWILLAPPDSTPKEVTSEFINAVSGNSH